MELALQILFGAISFICLSGGMNLLLKGSSHYLPQDLPPQRIMDNLFRFTSGIYFALGFLMIYVTLHSREAGPIIYLIGVVVIFSGLGRWYSKIKVGSAGKYFDNIMIVEILLGVAVMVLQYLIQR